MTSLVKTIDKQLDRTGARGQYGNKLGVFVVFCSDDPQLGTKLHTLIAREGIKHVVLSISRDKRAGPRRYQVAADAAMTVAVYGNRKRVIANFALDVADDLTPACTADILQSIRRVMP